MAEKLSRSEIADALKDEPLVTVAEACRMLGVSTANFRRDQAEKLENEVELPTSGDGRPVRLYFRSEIRQLARQRRNGHSRSRS